MLRKVDFYGGREGPARHDETIAGGFLTVVFAIVVLAMLIASIFVGVYSC